MACGVTCVSTDVGDTRDILGPAGLIVPPRDPPALARSLITLLEDAKLRKQFGEQARQRIVELYSLETAIARVSQHYRTLLST